MSFPRILFWLTLCAWLTAGSAHGQSARQWARARELMVEEELVANGIRNKGVIEVFRRTPRHEFIPPDQRRLSYFDVALPIGEHQTISPPLIVASMTTQLDPKPDDRVLEIGTGSGYQAAILAGLVRDVYTIEIVETLGLRARETLSRLGYINVHPKIGDGFQGWPEHAPFDKIIVTCSPEKVPQPLIDQLREGGTLVVPLGERYQQVLYRLQKVNGKIVSHPLESTFFVPMTGTAEKLRSVKPTPGHTALINGGFELDGRMSGAPAGWYYVRQAEMVAQNLSGHGERMLRFQNAERGRGSQALQAIGIDGRDVPVIDVACWVRGSEIGPGQANQEGAQILITFFDDNRSPVGQHMVGPWKGTFDWTEKRARLQVPTEARQAVIAIGLLGGTGQLDCDDLTIAAHLAEQQ